MFKKGYTPWNKGMTGEKSPSWKGGRPKCSICGKLLASIYANKCPLCHLKTRIVPSGENSINWKGGFPKCLDCGNPTANRKAKRCVDCDYKNRFGKFVGENAKNWKGGTTPENNKIRHSIEFRLWREAVFARDNWTCQKYGIKGGKLHPHHIQNFSQYPEQRFAIDNGITLSEKAHKEFHKKYGVRNNTRKQLLEYLA